MFATRLQPRLKIFSCDIYLQKQCKLFLSFALSLLLFRCDCGALSSQTKKKKHSRDVSDLSVTSTWWRDCTESFASTRSLFNYHAIIFVVIEYMIVGLILLQLLNRLCKEQSPYFLLGWTSALGFLVLKGSGPLTTPNRSTVQLSTMQLCQ